MIDYLEVFAVICGIMYLILLSKVIRWGWIFGIMSAALYAYICFNVSLYFQSILQCIYVFAGLWGFWSWSELKEPSETGTYHLPIKENIIVFFGAFICAILAYYLLSYTDQKSVLIDSFVSVFSLLATFLTIFRLIENWYYWWVINLLAIVLFYQQNLKATVFLYAVYLALSIYGYLEWRKKLVRS